jgi:hypothetical protein
LRGDFSRRKENENAAYKERYASFHLTKRRGKSAAKMLKPVFKHALGGADKERRKSRF